MNNRSIYFRQAPTITIFLFAYNQENFIKEACLSILEQDYKSPIEIIFSDDCSQDLTFNIMTQVARSYEGVHSIVLNKNKKNLGLIGHVNLSYKLSKGDLIFAAAGDDISLPDRVSKTIEAYRLSKKTPMSIYSSVYEIDENSKVRNIRKPPFTESVTAEKCVLSSALIIGAAHAWHRNIFDTFGEIEEDKAYEDLVLAYRSALLDGLVYLDEPLVKYRVNVGISYQHVINNKDKQHKEKFINDSSYYYKTMTPVLNQRLKDTSKIAGEDKLIKKITRAINRQDVHYNYLMKNYSFFRSISKSVGFINFLYFIKYWFRLARKGYL
ncbi:glycosyltransferase [Kordiimonas sp.]|uniref:glycosyltransferase n=1 Tax=Kordiimonas sp. TaxID=1970157 RepID=UPI003A8F758F